MIALNVKYAPGVKERREGMLKRGRGVGSVHLK